MDPLPTLPGEMAPERGNNQPKTVQTEVAEPDLLKSLHVHILSRLRPAAVSAAPLAEEQQGPGLCCVSISRPAFPTCCSLGFPRISFPSWLADCPLCCSLHLRACAIWDSVLITLPTPLHHVLLSVGPHQRRLAKHREFSLFNSDCLGKRTCFSDFGVPVLEQWKVKK